MSIRQAFWGVLGVWAGVICSSGFAQSTRIVPSFARVQEMPRSGSGEIHIGVMGQIAFPGVYVFDSAEPQLAELIRHAGGLTQQATKQIRIVRRGAAGQAVFFDPNMPFTLAPGDIVVADGPIETRRAANRHPALKAVPSIETADFQVSSPPSVDERFQHVALINVLDRPVILPVPETRANLWAITAFLGQDSSLVDEVKVLPVGARGRNSSRNAPKRRINVPSVLYFPQGRIRADALPKLPEVYRIAGRPEVPSPPPAEFPRVDAPVPMNSVPHLLPPAPAEPELIAEVRKAEREIPAPKLSASREETATIPPGHLELVPSQARSSEKDAAPRRSAWWPYAALALLIFTCAAVFAKLRTGPPQLEFAAPEHFAANADRAHDRRVARNDDDAAATAELEPAPAEDAPALPERIIDDVLQSMMRNELPIREETALPVERPSEPRAPQAKPKIRIDAPAGERAEPYIAKKPRPVPKVSEPAAETPATSKNAEDAAAGTSDENGASAEPILEKKSLGLLDRVLIQVNQSRAA